MTGLIMTDTAHFVPHPRSPVKGRSGRKAWATAQGKIALALCDQVTFSQADGGRPRRDAQHLWDLGRTKQSLSMSSAASGTVSGVTSQPKDHSKVNAQVQRLPKHTSSAPIPPKHIVGAVRMEDRAIQAGP